MWATRIFKTRTLATEACKKNRVLMGGVSVKPSRMVKVGDQIAIRKPPVTYTFRVLAVTERRMGAKQVPQYLENITPMEEYEILTLNNISGFVNRAKGLGRPTKKERRDLNEFVGSDTPTPLIFDWDKDWDDENV